MNAIEDLTEKLRKFRDDRDWKKYHTVKDLAISINLECSELLEHFQWKTTEEAQDYALKNKEAVGEELADVFKYSLALADILGIDIIAAATKKLEKDSAKYPVDKIKGKYIKYTKIK